MNNGRGDWLRAYVASQQNPAPELIEAVMDPMSRYGTGPEFEFDDIKSFDPTKFKRLPHHGKHHVIDRRITLPLDGER